MRFIAAIALATLIALPAQANGHWPAPGDVVAADARGLTLTNPGGAPRNDMPFGTPFHLTMHTLVSVFGHDVIVGFPQECGEGPLVSAHIPGQIDLMFQNDLLSGWILINDAALRTSSDLGVGSPAAALAREGDIEYFASGIGTEFSAEDYYGLLSEDRGSIQAIWTGTTCIFR